MREPGAFRLGRHRRRRRAVHRHQSSDPRLRRNLDLKILLFNNRIYGLTKGQYSPTSEFGKKTKSSPLGTIEQPIRPIQMALAAEATFVARTIYADPNHLAQTLEAAARHRGAAFVEILQNCRVFNDGAFDECHRDGKRGGRRILLEHGKPIRFGPAGGRLSRPGTWTRRSSISTPAKPARRLLVHDVQATSPALAALLAELEPPDFPMALGVFRDIERPTYDALLSQINAAVAQRGRGDLGKLLNAGTTWEVE